MNDGVGGQRRYGLRYRDGRSDRRGHGFLGFGERIVTVLDTGATTASFYDNRTTVEIGGRTVYPFAGQVVSQGRFAPALPTEANKNRVELLFAENVLDVVPTNGGQSYFTFTMTRTTNAFGEVETESTSSDDGIDEIDRRIRST